MCGVSVGTVKLTLAYLDNSAITVAGQRVLTSRQLEILSLVGNGYTDPEIGSELFLSRYTVENHIRDARQRLNAANRIQCVMMAVARELLILDYDGTVMVPHAHGVAA